MSVLRLTQNSLHAGGFAISPLPRHQYSEKHSIFEGDHLNVARCHPASGMLFLPSSHGMLPNSPPAGLLQQMQHDRTLQWPYDKLMAPEPLYFSARPTVVNETNGDDMSSVPQNVHGSSLDGTYSGSCAPYHRQKLWPDSLDPLPFAQNFEHCPLDGSICRQPFSSPCREACSRYSNVPEVTELPIPFSVPPRQPLHSSSSYLPHPYHSPDPLVRFMQEHCTSLPRHGRGACAIEYGELWLDEGELRKALIETDGKLIVLQCLWENNHSPCYLWIKGDKSSINAHIQKWHGGKPGEEKHEVDCRWSSCGKKMRKESITRHILSVHLGELWECRGCGKETARSDAHRQHIVNSDAESCRTRGALIRYSADARIIDASAALTNGGRQRCTDA